MTKTMVKVVQTLETDREAFAWRHPFIDQAPTLTLLSDDLVQQYERREVFAFESPDTGSLIFDVRSIKNAMVEGKLKFTMVEVELTADWVEHIRTNGGVEAEHMARLTAKDLRRPGVAIWWGHTGYTTLIDGNNRVVRRWDDGRRTFRCARIEDIGVFRYVCREGEEEQLFDTKMPEGMTSLGKKVIMR